MTEKCIVCGDMTKDATIYKGEYLVVCEHHSNEQIDQVKR